MEWDSGDKCRDSHRLILQQQMEVGQRQASSRLSPIDGNAYSAGMIDSMEMERRKWILRY